MAINSGALNRGTTIRKRWISTERLLLASLLLAPIAFLPPPPLAAKSPAKKGEKAPKSTFEEVTDVIQVEVPVNVVTRDGRPVTDLTAESFRLFDEGKRQELVGFEVVDLGKLDQEEAEARIAELPKVARRNFLLLFDFSFSTASSIVKARQAAHEFVLNALHPSDLVAIATFSLEYGPRLLVTFTPDRAQLARAIDTLGLARRPGVAEAQDPLRFLIEPPSASSASSGGPEGGDARDIRSEIDDFEIESMRIIGKQIERSQLSYERSRVTAWSRALADMAKSLNSVAGRKHVIYFSEGFDSQLLLGRRPITQGEEADQQMLDRVTGTLWMVHGEDTHGDTFLQGDLKKMLEEFKRADCVIQAVDVAGLRAGFDSTHARSTGVDSLFYMANETGGELFEATNDLTDQLERVLRRSQVTYILSFQPRKVEFDGSYHRLKVAVDGVKGARVSHRAGYYAPRPFAGLHPLEKSLLASDAIASAEPRHDVEMDVLAAPFRASEDMSYVPVIVEIQGESLLVGQQSDDLVIEVYTYVTNDRGEMRDYFSQMAEFNVATLRDKISDSGIKYYGHLELGPGSYLLRVLVRNSETGRTGVVASPLEIPHYETAETTLLPPFFMDDPANKWLLLRYRGEDDDGKSVIYPFTIKGIPFVPAARPALEAGKPVEFCLMTYNLGEGEPELEGWLVGADGEERSADGNLALLERTITGISGLDKLRATFRPKGLKDGEYTLKVALTDPATGVRQLNSIPIFVGN